MHISVIGIGMGNPDTLTLRAWKALRAAQLIVGARRILDSLPAECAGERIAAVAPDEIRSVLDRHNGCGEAAVALSGDTGFYSGAAKLLPLLEPYPSDVICGITTVQYLAALLRRPWQDVSLVSAHGASCNVTGAVCAAEQTFFLTGGKNTPASIVRELCEAGLGGCEVFVGENLSYPDEKLTAGRASELLGREFAPLSAVWVCRSAGFARRDAAAGIPDERFVRGEVPMTKQEVRAAILAKLGARPGETVYDIGAGTGSVGVELALSAPTITVYAVERVGAACALIRANREKFGAYNLRLTQGAAPEALSELPAPDRAFVGGSGGNLTQILACLQKKNPAVRVVVSAVAAETLSEALGALKALRFEGLEIAQISVSRSRQAGPYHMMTAQNPIFLLCAGGRDLT